MNSSIYTVFLCSEAHLRLRLGLLSGALFACAASCDIYNETHCLHKQSRQTYAVGFSALGLQYILSINNIGNTPKARFHRLAKVQACCINFFYPITLKSSICCEKSVCENKPNMYSIFNYDFFSIFSIFEFASYSRNIFSTVSLTIYEVRNPLIFQCSFLRKVFFHSRVSLSHVIILHNKKAIMQIIPFPIPSPTLRPRISTDWGFVCLL